MWSLEREKRSCFCGLDGGDGGRIGSLVSGEAGLVCSQLFKETCKSGRPGPARVSVTIVGRSGAMATRSPRGQRTQGARATGRARLAVATRGRYAEAGARGRHSRSPPACDARSSLSLALPAPRHAVPHRKSAMTQFLLRERERGGWRRREQGEQEGRE